MIPRAALTAIAMVASLVSASPVHARCSSTILADIPIEMDGRRPKLHVKLNGVDEILLVDSGAFFSAIKPSVVKTLKLLPDVVPDDFSVGGVGGSANVSLVTVKSIMLAGQTLRGNIEFMVLERAGEFDGLLGQNFLGLHDVEYDLRGGKVRLLEPVGDCASASMAYWANGAGVSVVPIESIDGSDRRTMGEASINGVKVKALFDTGFVSSALSLEAAKRIGLSVDGPDARYLGETRGIGRGGAKTWDVPLNSFTLGGEEIRNTRIQVVDLSQSTTTGEEMVLGADFFLSHHVYVANSQRKLFFTYGGGPVFLMDAVADGPPPPAKPSGAP